MLYRPHVLAKNERNQALIADYLGGLSRAGVAEKYELSPSYVATLLNRHGVTLPPEERDRRNREKPVVGNRWGSRGAWPECPNELRDDYRNLRRKGFPAIEARSLLERMVA